MESLRCSHLLIAVGLMIGVKIPSWWPSSPQPVRIEMIEEGETYCSALYDESHLAERAACFEGMGFVTDVPTDPTVETQAP